MFDRHVGPAPDTFEIQRGRDLNTIGPMRQPNHYWCLLSVCATFPTKVCTDREIQIHDIT